MFPIESRASAMALLLKEHVGQYGWNRLVLQKGEWMRYHGKGRGYRDAPKLLNFYT